MSLLNAAQNAETHVDMTQTVNTSSARVLPEGTALVRLTEYIDYGTQLVTKFGTNETEPKPVMRLGFRIVGGQGKNTKGEIEQYVKEVGQFPYIRTFDVVLSQHIKSRAVKLFNLLNYKRTHKHFANMLGGLFFLKITHETKDGKTVHRPQWDSLSAPINPVTSEYVDAPAITDEHVRLFLWDNPTKEMWDSLYIEGKFDDGQSKNKDQERILEATNYLGSRLEALLNGGALPELTQPAAPAEAEKVETPATEAEPDTDVPF